MSSKSCNTAAADKSEHLLNGICVSKYDCTTTFLLKYPKLYFLKITIDFSLPLYNEYRAFEPHNTLRLKRNVNAYYHKCVWHSFHNLVKHNKILKDDICICLSQSVCNIKRKDLNIFHINNSFIDMTQHFIKTATFFSLIYFLFQNHYAKT